MSAIKIPPLVWTGRLSARTCGIRTEPANHHRFVGETVGLGVELAAHVLEPDLTQVAHGCVLRPERLQSGCLARYCRTVCFHKQERIGNEQPLDAVPRRPGERRQQAAILRDVVRQFATPNASFSSTTEPSSR